MSESPHVCESVPAISVVVPTYGRPEAIKVAVDTVKAQSITDWELIIVDDNPPDSVARKQTREIMQGLVNSRINYVELSQNSGACVARNTGVKHASANYIAFLDDDDKWHSDKLKNCLACFQQDIHLDLLVHNLLEIYQTRRTHLVFNPSNESFFNYFLALASGVSCSAIVVKKSSFLAADGFDPDLQSYQDLDLILRMSRQGNAHALQQELLYYLLDDHGITFNFKRKISGARRLLLKFRDEFSTPAGRQGVAKLNEALGDYYMMSGNSKEALMAYKNANKTGAKFLLKRILAAMGMASTFQTLLTAKKRMNQA